MDLPGKAGTAKVYSEQMNVGRAKYLVSFHDGVKTHNDGSAFYDVRIFTSQRRQQAFIQRLITEGYQRRG